MGERDKGKGGSNGTTFGDSAHRDHACNANLLESGPIRASVTHTSRATDVLSRVLSLDPASRVQIVDDAPLFEPDRQGAWFRTAGFDSRSGTARARALACVTKLITATPPISAASAPGCSWDNLKRYAFLRGFELPPPASACARRYHRARDELDAYREQANQIYWST